MTFFLAVVLPMSVAWALETWLRRNFLASKMWEGPESGPCAHGQGPVLGGCPAKAGVCPPNGSRTCGTSDREQMDRPAPASSPAWLAGKTQLKWRGACRRSAEEAGQGQAPDETHNMSMVDLLYTCREDNTRWCCHPACAASSSTLERQPLRSDISRSSNTLGSSFCQDCPIQHGQLLGPSGSENFRVTTTPSACDEQLGSRVRVGDESLSRAAASADTSTSLAQHCRRLQHRSAKDTGCSTG